MPKNLVKGFKREGGDLRGYVVDGWGGRFNDSWDELSGW